MVVRQRRKEIDVKHTEKRLKHDDREVESEDRKGKGACRQILCVFDCVWTLVLLVLLIILVLVLVPPLRNFLYGTVHVYAYQINRIARLSFLTLHPYLLYVGLDLTNLCLLQNPFAGDASRCPCINQPEPIEISIRQGTLPRDVLDDPYNAYILRNAIPVEKLYGRETLKEYLSIHSRLPDTCFLSQSGSEGPSRIQQLTEDSYWSNWLQGNSSWDFSWVECLEDPSTVPISTLLPSLDPLFAGSQSDISPSSQYSLSTQWGRSMPYGISSPEDNDRQLMLVLQGTVRVMVSVCYSCREYCRSLYRGSLLYPGDTLLYDERYWSYTTQTWSNTSFIRLTKVNIRAN